MLAGGVGEADRPFGAAECRHGLGELRDGVVGVEAGAVCRAAARDEPDPDQRLLAHLQQVRPAIADSDRVAADLADRLRRAREPLGLVLDDERGALDSAVLLVGEEREDEVALGLLARAQDVGDRGQDHGVHVLHVDRTAAPQHPVADLAREGIDAPVLGDGGDDVEVTVQNEGGLARVAPGNPRHDVRAARESARSTRARGRAPRGRRRRIRRPRARRRLARRRGSWCRTGSDRGRRARPRAGRSRAKACRLRYLPRRSAVSSPALSEPQARGNAPRLGARFVAGRVSTPADRSAVRR